MFVCFFVEMSFDTLIFNSNFSLTKEREILHNKLIPFAKLVKQKKKKKVKSDQKGIENIYYEYPFTPDKLKILSYS